MSIFGRKTKLEAFQERTTFGSVRVNREAGVIRGVRILGPQSLNGRKYLPEAIQRAVPLYEGKAVNLNHPPTGGISQERSIGDRFGWLRGVHEHNGGLNGDLHYLTAHPLAEAIAEAAERNPNLFGLSHNAEGRTRRENETTIVEEITQVRSVDLVGDPATTRGLFESLRGGGFPAGLAFVRKITEQMEADGMMPGDSGEGDAPTTSPVTLEQIVGIIQGDGADHDKIEALRKLLKVDDRDPAPADVAATESYRREVASILEQIRQMKREQSRLLEMARERPIGGTMARQPIPEGTEFDQAISTGYTPRRRGDRRQKFTWLEG